MSRKRTLFIIKKLELKSKQYLQPEEQENPYSHTVLIGNWFEERFANKVDRRAITPGTYGESGCTYENTLYKSDFKQPIRISDRQACDEYIRLKQEGFGNRLNSEQTNIKLWDGDQFNKNITTLKDIMYRIKPSEISNSSELLPLSKRKMDEDYMRSFGNSTRTGLLLWRECEKRKEEGMAIDVSHYKNHFKPIKLVARRVMCKGTQKKTNI